MKLHNINKVLGVGLAALLLTACTDGNDWSVDSSKARLFSVSNSDISIESDMTDATITFKTSKGATSYKLEMSTDELNDNVAEGATANSKVYTYDAKEAVDSKITAKITGLKKDTRYWLRIRSVTDGKNPSNWTYYNKNNHAYFKTKAEQIFNTTTSFATKTIPAKNLKESEVTLTWKLEADGSQTAVTHLLLTVNGNEQTITLDATDQAARSKTLKYADYGITAGSDFNIKIYNSDDKRGEFSLTAPAARPAGLHELATGETIEGLISAGTGDIIIGIPASTSDDPTTDMITVPGITIPATVTSVTLYGLAGGAPRLLNFTKQIAFASDVTNISKIRFENLQIQTSAKFGGFIYPNGTSNALTIDAIEFEEITIPKLPQSSLIQLNNANGVTVKKLYINHLYGKDLTDKDTRFIYANNNNNVFEEIEINKSTFVGMKNAMFDNNGKGTFKKIVLNDVTIYNSIGSGKYFVSAKNTNPAPTVEAYRTIFAKSYGATCRGIQSILKGEDVKAAYTFASSYMTTDFVLETKKDDTTGELVLQMPFYVGNSVGASTKIMKDPKNGNYTITDATIEGGDPRWMEPADD